MRYLLIALVFCAAAQAPATDWPRDVQGPQGTITLFKPQIDDFNNDHLSARAAVSVTPTDGSGQIFGALWLDCRVRTDQPGGTVMVENATVREIKFPNGTNPQTAAVRSTLESEIPRLNLTFPLDEIRQEVKTARQESESSAALDVAPPTVIVKDHPAVLVRIDGDPVLTNVEGTALQRVVNTPFFLVRSSGTFYLHGGDAWYSAENLRGPWQPGAAPPAQVVEAYEQSKSDDASAGDSTANDVRARTGKTPEIVVATEPAELIASDGPLQFAPIKGTGLLYASNTPAKLFLQIAGQGYYLLLSGRWYTSRAVAGPWGFVASDKLPGDFAKIPPGSPSDDVLADVPGTPPAKNAVLDAQVPQMAEVDRAKTAVQIEYDGEPRFEPIVNTEMEYAVNSATPVVRVGLRYYACEKGVWFESPAPLGPWAVCIRVPAVIYTIPPRCPIYYVRFVRVYGFTPAVAYVGYTPGYTGCYVFGGTVVYGTGFYYRPWYHRYYFPRPWTWGWGVHYDPWTGWSMGFGGGWWRPRGWFAFHWGAVYAGWWGPVGYRPFYRPVIGPVYRAGYHPVYRPVVWNRTGTGGMRTIGVTRGATVYSRWTSGVRQPAAVPATRSQAAAARSTVRPMRGHPDRAAVGANRAARAPEQVRRGGRAAGRSPRNHPAAQNRQNRERRDREGKRR